MTSKYNILMLNYEFPPIGGGAGKANLNLLKEFADNPELSIDVLTSAPKPGMTAENFAGNITIYKVGVHKKNLHFWRKSEVAEWLIKSWLCYRGLVRKNKYDLVHAFFGFPTAYLCYLSAKKLPYIISLRGSDVPGVHARLAVDYKILAPLFRSIWKKADKLVANSQGLKSRALSFMPSLDYEVIPNGVNLDEFSPSQGKDGSEEFRIITVGRLSVTKRVEILIEAVSILVEQGRKVKFIIVGAGALEAQFREMVREKGLSGAVEMTGRVESEKVPDLYRDSDLFVSASRQEGMSNAMLEAMASGLPIVTTRCEGVEELISGNGIIVSQASAEEISGAIGRLIENKNSLKDMSLAARAGAQSFTWSSVAGKYLQCYRQVCEKNK